MGSLLLAGCEQAPPPLSQIPNGVWGGTAIELVVQDDESRLIIGCVMGPAGEGIISGSIPLDANSRFDKPIVWYERGGAAMPTPIGTPIPLPTATPQIVHVRGYLKDRTIYVSIQTHYNLVTDAPLILDHPPSPSADPCS
jgi:hypothetical protein